MEDRVYFKDIYNKRPVHYDCTIGTIKLAWDNTEIDIFSDSNGPEYHYRPVIDGEYAKETWEIYLSGEFFTKEDLDEYIKKVKNYKEELERNHREQEKVLTEIKTIIDSKVNSNIKDRIYCLYYWYYVFSNSYTLGYDPIDKIFEINKFHPNQPIDRRFYFWNHDDEFKTIKSDNRDEIIDKFIELVTEEYKDI